MTWRVLMGKLRIANTTKSLRQHWRRHATLASRRNSRNKGLSVQTMLGENEVVGVDVEKCQTNLQVPPQHDQAFALDRDTHGLLR